MPVPLKVLVVDDSAYMRKVITEIINRSPFLEVVGTAWDGLDALQKVTELEPDVVVLDLYMPEKDGVGFLKEQMASRPVPVVVCSSAAEDGENVLAAMDAGAVEFVQKPTSLANEKVYAIDNDLIRKVTMAGSIPLERIHPAGPQANGHVLGIERLPTRVQAVVIGISTGGPQALRYLVPRFPANFPVPIAIVLHMPEGYTGPFAQKLNELSQLEVLEAEEGLEMQPGRAIIAQAGRHLKLKKGVDGSVRAHLSLGPDDHLHRPAVDVLFRSAAEVYGSGTLGVVMTGMGSDGTEGAAWIHAEGGKVITEAESSCVIYGMPQSVVEAGLSNETAPLQQIAECIMESL